MRKSRGPLAFFSADSTARSSGPRIDYLGGVGLLIRRSGVGAGRTGSVSGPRARGCSRSAGGIPAGRRSGRVLHCRCDCRMARRSTARTPPSPRSKQRLGKVKGVESWFVIGGHGLHHADRQFQRRDHRGDHHSLGRAQDRKTCSWARFWRERSRRPPRFRKHLPLCFGLPPILGLSNTGGFQFMLEDRAGGDLRATQPSGRRAGECGAQTTGNRQRGQHLPR